MAVMGRKAEDMAVVMLQFCGGAMSQLWSSRLRIWGSLCGTSGLGFEDMGAVALQFWGGRLRIWRLLCGSFGAGG